VSELLGNHSTTESKGLNYAQVLHAPFWDQLKDCKRIMIAGCGGGYDMMSGIPLFFGLEKAGATCFLANVAFTDDSDITDVKVISEGCYEVNANSKREGHWTIKDESYWPELFVSRWFKEKENRDVPVYMFVGCGVKPLQNAFQKLVDSLQLDAIILADGGTDSLMFGDECGLGTPTEDMTSISAVYLVKNVKKKFLINLGLGIDCHHGVVHTHYLENMATIDKLGGFLGAFSLHHTMEEAKKFEEIYTTSLPVNSIVCSSILSAVKGEFGNHHSPYTRSRTQGSSLYISPLMCMYFTFLLDVVAQKVIYLPQLYETKTLYDVRKIINNFRTHLTDIRQASVIPY